MEAWYGHATAVEPRVALHFAPRPICSNLLGELLGELLGALLISETSQQQPGYQPLASAQTRPRGCSGAREPPQLNAARILPFVLGTDGSLFDSRRLATSDVGRGLVGRICRACLMFKLQPG